MSGGNYVYVIRYREHDHKIGFSNRPQVRFTVLRAQTEASAIVRTWHRPAGDAQRVESIAHRIVREWRLKIQSQIERFGLSEITACMVVDLAVHIADDEAHLRARGQRDEPPPPSPPEPPALVHPSIRLQPPRPREQYGPPAWLAPELYGPPPPPQPVQIGYALCRSERDAAPITAKLIAAGAEERRIYMDLGRRRGPGFAAARKACREGDTLILAKTTADPELRAALLAKGATWKEITRAK